MSFESLLSHISGLEFTSTMGILVYWVPLVICLIGFTVRTWAEYQQDVANRDLAHKPPAGTDQSSTSYHRSYVPRLTVGTLVYRLVLSVIPLLNALVCSFDLGPKALRWLFVWLERTLDFPLVPPRKW